MMSTSDTEHIRRFLERNLDALLADATLTSGVQREMRRRTMSVLVDRFCLGQPGLAWEEVAQTAYGLCAVLDSLDELEHSALRLIHDAGDDLPTARALAWGIDELRSDYIRFQKHMHKKEIIECSALEHISQPLFLVHLDRLAESMNGTARRLRDELGGERCHELFFSSSTPCRNCPLDEVLQKGVHRECAATTDSFLPTVGLSPMTPGAALAYVSGWEERPSQAKWMATSGVGVLDSIGSGVVMLSADGQVVFANRAAEDLLGSLRPGDKLADVAPDLTLSADGQQREFKHCGCDSETTIGYRCVPCTMDGVDQVVVTLRDRTELRRLRSEMEQMQRLSEVGRMYATIAHEIRNPLAGIMATIQSVEKEAKAAGLAEPMATIEAEVRRLGNLLNSFFSYVRWQPPRRRPTDLLVVAERALRAAAPKLRRVHVDLAAGQLRPILVDPDQMEQVILNLLLNAADALPADGHIHVRLGIDAGRLVVSVEDDGCGISEQDLHRVFDAFFTTKPHGTGLGLSVCYRIVTAHGGHIDIESERLKGTRVAIQLPLAQAVA